MYDKKRYISYLVGIYKKGVCLRYQNYLKLW
jgi:hypothetical protein